MTVKEFLKSTINADDLIGMQMIRPRAKCNDGFFDFGAGKFLSLL